MIPVPQRLLPLPMQPLVYLTGYPQDLQARVRALIEQGRRDEARRLLDGLTAQAMEAAGGSAAELERVRGLLAGSVKGG